MEIQLTQQAGDENKAVSPRPMRLEILRFTGQVPLKTGLSGVFRFGSADSEITK